MNVAVPVTVTVSPELSPSITLPSAFNCPSTSKFPVKVELPVTSKVPATNVLPVPLATVNLSVFTTKLPVTAAEPKVAAPETSNAPFKSTSLLISTSSEPLVVINLT